MKKIIVLLLVSLMIISSTVLVFAEEISDEVRVERTKENKRAKVTELFEEFNPEGLKDFNNIIEGHKNFHDGVRAEKEIIKLEYQATRDALKIIAESGDLSKEEIKAMYASYKEVREAFRADVEELKISKQADVEANKADLVIVRKTLISATKEEVIDDEYVSELLDQIVVLLEEHLDIDLYYYSMLKGLKEDITNQLL